MSPKRHRYNNAVGAPPLSMEPLESRVFLTIVSFAASVSKAFETATGLPSKPGAITISRDGSISAATPALTVNLAITGTAVVGTNYTALSTTVVIPQGKSSVTLPISVINDLVADPTLTVIVTAQPSADYTVSPTKPSATVSIIDNSPIVSLTVSTPTANEPAPGVSLKNGAFTITRAGPVSAATPALNVNVNFSGTALAGTNYAAVSTPITIPLGKSSVTVPITALNDNTADSTLTVIAALATSTDYNINAVKSAGTVSILDTAPVISVKATDASAAQSAPGVAANPAVFTITRSGPVVAATPALTVDFSLSGTATAGTDYADPGTIVIIPAGKASATVTITPTALMANANQSVILTLTPESTYHLSIPASKDTAAAAILDSTRVITLSTKAAAPGTTLTISGHFNPSDPTKVLFTDSLGNVTTVDPTTVTATSIQVAVPVLIDPTTGTSKADFVSVAVHATTVSGLLTYLPVSNVAIDDLPQTGLAVAGALTNAYLAAMQGLIQTTITNYNKVAAASNSTVNVSGIVANLQTLAGKFAAAQQLIAPILADPTATATVGQFNGQTISINAAALNLNDRLIAGLLLGNKGAAPVVPAFRKAAAMTPANILSPVITQLTTLFSTLNSSNAPPAATVAAGIGYGIGSAGVGAVIAGLVITAPLSGTIVAVGAGVAVTGYLAGLTMAWYLAHVPVANYESANTVKGSPSFPAWTTANASMTAQLAASRATDALNWLTTNAPSFDFASEAAAAELVTPQLDPNTGGTVAADIKANIAAISANLKSGVSTFVSGTWIGSLTFPVFGFGDDDTTLTMILTQSGSKVGGSYSAVVNDGVSVDAQGTIFSGTFISGSLSGNNLTLTDNNGQIFKGVVTGTVFAGTSSILQGGPDQLKGVFSVNKQ